MRLIDADALMRCIPAEEIVSRMAVASATTIEPDCKWIPVSERLPEKDGEYITTVEDGEGMFVTSNDWRHDWKQWGFWSIDEEYDEVWRRVTNVVAWCELPAPYKEVEK